MARKCNVDGIHELDRQSQTSVSMIYGIILGLKEQMKGSFVPVH